MFPNLCTVSTETSAPPSRGVVPLADMAGWTLRRLRRPDEIRSLGWQNIAEESFWVSSSTLSYLAGHPQGFSTEALLLEEPSTGTRLLISLQIFTFSAAGNVSESAEGERSKMDFRRRLLSPFSFKVAALGQLLTSGPYAVDSDRPISPTLLAALLAAAGETILSSNERYSAVMIKDAFRANDVCLDALMKDGYYRLPVDPIMELEILREWTSIGDYLAAITSKYRVRYRRARGKFEGLIRRPLGLREIQEMQSALFHLYQNASDGADYNAVVLNAGYFTWLARTNAEKLAGATGFTGYFDADQLVGFTTTILNGSVLHAHYLGMVEDYKTSHHLYHNMLFDLLKQAISLGCRKLDYGRTALEIKSSVGAVAVDYACLLKAKSSVLNQLVPIFTPAVYKLQEWQPRSPFKS